MESKKYIRDKRSPIPKNKNVSKVMSANKSKDTKPELTFRKALWKEGKLGYRLHKRIVNTRPDIVYNKHKIAIFINGCYWHRCPKCDLSLPKSNVEFWKQKFKRNIERDRAKTKALEDIGWKVYTIWECDIIKNVKL